MYLNLKSFLFLFAISFFTIPFANAQEVRVTDNKGTINTIRNNKVYKSDAQPGPDDKILQNDLWIDTSTVPAIFKVRNDSNLWESITSLTFGKSLFSVATTIAASNYEFTPGILLNFVEMDGALPKTSIEVEVGDILDIRVNISVQHEEDAVANLVIADVFRFYTTDDTILGSPTMIESLITGGNNTNTIATGSLNQLFTVVTGGTLEIGIEVKHNSTDERKYSTTNSGKGGLQVIIYR
jgi:hypothetical protein